MSLAHAAECLRCGGTNWVPYRHWRLCGDCEASYIAGLTPAKPKPELFNKGIPTKN